MNAMLRRLTMFDRVAIAVAAVAAGALLLELLWAHDLGAPAATAETVAAVEPAALDVIPVGPVSEYSSVSERPLFTYDRRPFVVVAEVAPVVAGPRAEFQLTAVIITDTAQIALLRSNLTPAVQRVAVSQTIDGWTLAEVHPDSVLLRRNAESMSVHLRPEPSASAAPGAARRRPLTSANR
jgi:hypothetical protein